MRGGHNGHTFVDTWHYQVPGSLLWGTHLGHMNCHREKHALYIYVFPQTVLQNIMHRILLYTQQSYCRVWWLLPAAAEIPLREPRTWSGKVRDGSMNVVEFGPKLLKKKVKLSSRCHHVHHRHTERASFQPRDSRRFGHSRDEKETKREERMRRYDVERRRAVRAPRRLAAKWLYAR